MAVANGDIVAVYHPSDTNVWYQYQPPRFGVVEDRTGIDVVWENGLFEQGIALDNSLDVIFDPPAGRASMEGKVVRLSINPDTTLEPSPSYDAVVIREFRRQRGGNGNPTATRVLVQLLSNGVYLEVWSTQVSRLDDR